MNQRKIDCFFYGLFMDADILTQAKINAFNPRRAFVAGFELKIGKRATLVAKPGAKSFGVLYSLTHAELDKLYQQTGLEDYRAEAVLAHCKLDESNHYSSTSTGNELVAALCFNLLETPSEQEQNLSYATQLQEVLAKLNFPQEYIESVGKN